MAKAVYDPCEIKERQEAELEFIEAAYSNDEAWITSKTSLNHGHDKVNVVLTQHCIHRRLRLPTTRTKCSSSIHQSDEDSKVQYYVPIELILIMPQGYPIDPNEILNVQAKVQNNDKDECIVSASSPIRKLAFDSLNNLIQACADVASDEYLEEAVLAVFTRADEWIETEWEEILELKYNEESSNAQQYQCLNARQHNGINGRQNQKLILGRKLIFSHHIIAKSKRKALKDLSSEYELGGYAKIGWPGIIIIEGEAKNCNKFVDEIKKMRWQHLVVRGEELIEIPSNHDCSNDFEALNGLRKFPLQFEELNESQMSYLAQICRDSGLEDLFMTSMNIYKESNSDEVNRLLETSLHGNDDDKIYGVLVHIDHMNDEKGYQKWIQKASKSVGCSFLLKWCHYNDDIKARRIILVCLFGHINAVKQMLKRWRTSRVDIDSRGNPCLERMMTILAEGYLKCNTIASCDSQMNETSIEELQRLLKSLGSELWLNAFIELINFE
jgi:hypothetical protein